MRISDWSSDVCSSDLYDLASLATIERALAIPFKRFDRPLVGFLSRSEVNAIIDAPDRSSWAGQRDRAFFSMMYNTGARVSEMIGIRRSEEHTSELQSLMRISYAVFCLQKTIKK